MENRDLFDENDGAWRERLPRWTAPVAPPRLEEMLRQEFRKRRPGRRFSMWAGRAAVGALVVAAALAVRMGTPTPVPERHALTIVAANEVRTELDLTDFEPVAKMTMTKWTGGMR
jgi:hypothetical protein